MNIVEDNLAQKDRQIGPKEDNSNPLLRFCFFQNLKRVRIRQALKLSSSIRSSFSGLAFSEAVFEVKFQMIIM